MEASPFGQLVENLTDQRLALETGFWTFLARCIFILAKKNCLLMLDFVCLSIQHSHQGCYGTFLYSFNKQNFRFVETEALGSIMEYTGDLFTSGNNDHCIELWCSHMCTSATYLALSFS